MQWNISKPSNARRRRSAGRGKKIRVRCIEEETGSGRNGRNSSVNRNNPLCGFSDLYARRRNIWEETNRGNARPISRFCRIFRSGGRTGEPPPVFRSAERGKYGILNPLYLDTRHILFRSVLFVVFLSRASAKENGCY